MPLSLYRRGRIWHIRGSVAGRRIRQSTGLIDKRQAEIFKARLENQAAERHAFGREVTLTFAQAALTYLESGGDGRFLGPILQHLGPEKLLADVTNDTVNDIARVVYPGCAPSTINRQVITPISAVLNMAADDELAPRRRLRRRKEGQGRLDWLRPASFEAMLTDAPVTTQAKIAFLLGTGARTGEMFQLDRADLHLESQEAFVRASKNGEMRMLRFPTRTKRILATAGLPEVGAVFRTPKGKPYKIRTNGGGQFAEAFGQARDRAKLGPEITPHVLRHTWATWFWAHNKDLVQLMAFGGWKTAAIALRYTKLAPASLADELFDHGWDFRVSTNQTQAIPMPTPKQLHLLGNN